MKIIITVCYSVELRKCSFVTFSKRMGCLTYSYYYAVTSMSDLESTVRNKLVMQIHHLTVWFTVKSSDIFNKTSYSWNRCIAIASKSTIANDDKPSEIVSKVDDELNTADDITCCKLHYALHGNYDLPRNSTGSGLKKRAESELTRLIALYNKSGFESSARHSFSVNSHSCPL